MVGSFFWGKTVGEKIKEHQVEKQYTLLGMSIKFLIKK
jgi:hypothetical protein